MTSQRPPKLQVERIYLEQLKFKLIDTIGSTTRDSLSVREIPEYELQGWFSDVAYEVSGYVLGHRISGENITKSKTVKKEFTALDGPFQRWKQRHMQTWWLGWFVRWRPLRHIRESFEKEVTLTVTTEDYATFPNASYAPPPENIFGRPIFQRIVAAEIR